MSYDTIGPLILGFPFDRKACRWPVELALSRKLAVKKKKKKYEIVEEGFRILSRQC